jgi:hypothetical protein
MFVLGLLFLATVLCALAFYGDRLQGLLLPELRSEAGLSISFGLAGYTTFCGVLEITQIASRPLLLAVVGIGLLGFAGSLMRSPGGRRVWHFRAMQKSVVAAFAAFGVLCAIFLINAAHWHYGFLDDVLGYLVFPERILSEGSIGRDPFNFRRIESGLSGGGAYLYVLFRAGLPLAQTRLADLGVGSACLLLLVADHAREQGVTGLRLALLLLITLAVIVFSPVWNNTPETTGKALLFALLRLSYLLQPQPPSFRRGAALGLLFFAAVALKTSYLPAAVASLVAFYIASLRYEPVSRLVGEAAVTGAVATALMLPWMAASYATAATLWYPLLGTGTLSPVEVSGIAAPYTYFSEAGRLLVVVAPAILIALAAWFTPELRARRVFLATLALCSTAFMLISQVKITVFGYRYGHAGMAAVLLFFLPFASQCRPGRLIRVALPALVAVMLVAVATKDARRTEWFDSGWIAELFLGPTNYVPGQWRTDLRPQLRTMQSAVPPGEPMMVLLSWPALLDFRRNPIAVMDHAGMMGPPGRPPPNDPVGWSRYLLRHGIGYVAYSYSDEAVFTKRFAERERNRYREPWQASAYMIADSDANIQMRETLIALRKLGTVVYDDGSEFVVKLKG